MTTQIEAEKKRERILAYVRNFWRHNGYGPSVRDIQEGCGISSASLVMVHVTNLERQKRILRDPIVARSIRVSGACPTCGCEGH